MNKHARKKQKIITTMWDRSYYKRFFAPMLLATPLITSLINSLTNMKQYCQNIANLVKLNINNDSFNQFKDLLMIQCDILMLFYSQLNQSTITLQTPIDKNIKSVIDKLNEQINQLNNWFLLMTTIIGIQSDQTVINQSAINHMTIINIKIQKYETGFISDIYRQLKQINAVGLNYMKSTS